jgi:type II restriction enzyme
LNRRGRRSFETDGCKYQLPFRTQRTAVYNLTPPFLKNNVDLCLFDCKSDDLSKATYNLPGSYITLGELKGGIDPAVADEHWKTARSALSRIKTGFAKAKLTLHTFFIGAAIEKKMATEIWDMLGDGTLENAANLTNDDQVVSISRWLCVL